MGGQHCYSPKALCIRHSPSENEHDVLKGCTSDRTLHEAGSREGTREPGRLATIQICGVGTTVPATWQYEVSVQAKSGCTGPSTCCRAFQASPVNDGLQLEIIAGMLRQPQRHQQHSSCCGVQFVTASSCLSASTAGRGLMGYQPRATNDLGGRSMLSCFWVCQ